MPTRRTGLIALALMAASAALSVHAGGRQAAAESPAAGGLSLEAPLPTQIPPGTTLAIGDPTTQAVLEHTGWAKDLPFTIKWAEISGGPGITEAFHAKVLDGGSAMNIPPIHATWIGIPVRIVAIRQRADWRERPTFQLAIAPRAGIDSLADLKGKRIAFSPGQAQGELVLKVLQSQGLTAKDVTLVELPSTSADAYINAMVAGQVDAAPIGAGTPTKRYLDGYARDGARVLAHGQRDDFQTLYVREEVLRDPAKAAALRQYVQLWARAIAWQNENRSEWTSVYYRDRQGLSADDAAHAVAAEGERIVPADWTGAVRLEQASIVLMAAEADRPAFSAEQLFDRRFEPVAAQAYAQARAPARLAAAPFAGPRP
ncbi:ABC transporter substrate-binding protein [Phenylobacterium sp.]|uniref:ABC transporter substrate-binding protein n=1 Tax=Phenylobacterium sp. TaxID=1871053 RepID=UPI002E31A63D|nr:ABC transporter substrate-binding protein [Phenylobacterium sp.]HEX2560138.1 ABC transporter substrate-binding protein [Phenylobacterium sp.]